jgi:hypothetical protein
MKALFILMALLTTTAHAEKQYQFDELSMFYLSDDFCFASNPALGYAAIVENAVTGELVNGCWREGITNTYEILVEVGRDRPEEYIFDREKFKEVN